MKVALNFFWVRNGRRKTGQIHNFALTAIKIAKHWVEAPTAQIKALQVIRRQVDPGSSGMTERNRARLRQFDDPENLRRLIDMPGAILAGLLKSEAVSYVGAVKLQSALAVAILLVAPMRIKNLAGLRLDRHLVLTRIGGVRHIVIPAQEVKNREALAFQVSEHLGKLLDAYLKHGRPVLAAVASSFLFPARQGGAKTPAQLGAQIKRTIAQETGIDLNAHAFRHLTATLFLRENPGEYETAKQFLGHKNLATTVKSYCGVEQSDALRRLDGFLLIVTAARAGRLAMSDFRRLPIEEWPARDRKIWTEGVEPKGLFDAAGAGANWSERSRRKTAGGYGYWLSWLEARGGCDPHLDPADRVTPKRVAAYVAELHSQRADYTVLCRIEELLDALRVLAPDKDWNWLARVYRDIRAVAQPVRDKLSRLKPIDELAALGERIMHEAETTRDWSASALAVLGGPFSGVDESLRRHSIEGRPDRSFVYLVSPAVGRRCRSRTRVVGAGEALRESLAG